MGSSLDALNAPSSLTQRRQAASSLPNFELPPPNNLQLAAGFSGQKFPPLSMIPTSQPASNALSLGNLLTPPSNSSSEASSGHGISNHPVHNGITPNSQGMPVLPYTPTFWNTGNTPTGFSSGFTPQPWSGSTPLFPPRSTFSPVPGSAMRNHNSPAAGEHSTLPPPPYELQHVPQYSHGMSLQSPNSGSMPGLQHSMSNGMLSGGHKHTSQSPVPMTDATTKPSGPPTLYTSMSNSSNGQHPAYSYPTPTTLSQSPHPQSAPANRVSPPIAQQGFGQNHGQSQFIRPPYPSYTLPAMPGPAMSNVHSPGAQLSMVGSLHAQMLPMGFNSGYAANPGMYGQHRTNSPQQPAANDRPFKCDQCPQSFNRNHDLKRHKRIHLAVKPFPCNHCDKSFSRKDALKRHILVKGCGSRGMSENSRDDAMKSDSGSDEASDTHVLAAVSA